jgi:hypothetical protein
LPLETDPILSAAERGKVTPVDTRTAAKLTGYFNRISGVSAGLVGEAGRLPTSC